MDISVFKNARSTDPVTVSLEVFLNSQKHRQQIELLRMELDKKKRDELKKDLPAATISGTFKKREIAGITEYNGLVCLDYDGKDNPTFTPAEMKAILQEFGETLYCGLSVSAQGVFAIIRTDNDDPQKHGAVCDFLGNLIGKTGLMYDRACKDVSRLRFVSYDPQPYYNPAAEAFTARAVLERLEQQATHRPPRPLRIRTTEASGSDTTRKKVEQYLEELERSNTDITDQYDNWTKLGFALANEFGADGEDYFHRLSAINSKYDYSETEKKYQNFLRNHSGRVSIGTFFSICNSSGIRI